MGRGGDSRPLGPVVRKRSAELKAKLKRAGSDVLNDAVVLKNIWFNRVQGDDHKERLESFYGGQAAAYDQFRSKFLWGRKPMLAACAARAEQQHDLVWVDLGGGTGENVDLMSEYLPLERFKAIYVVDLCASLCEQARAKVAAKGWTNVHVVEGDACTWRPELTAHLVTFSYSLSMIPPFNAAVDHCLSYLDPASGLLGVADFYVSAKHDLPLRQMPWARRFFWQSTFDLDGIHIGPERRDYLDHRLSRVWEMNSQGSIPWVPYLRAPFYVWVGRVKPLARVVAEPRVEAPPCFPPTFLYTQSWEDPRPDIKVLDINKQDTVLTLTSGGCNALNLLIHGAGQVVAVDCNPAQSSLLELKAAAIRHLDFEDVWALFGEGRHPHARAIFDRKLGPWLSQAAYSFWSTRLWYFESGLYYQGGMGQVVYYFQLLAAFVGLGPTVNRLASSSNLKEQQAVWDRLWFVRFFRSGPAWLINLCSRIVTLLVLNRFVLWFGGGVPCKQYRLIHKDNVKIATYVGRTLDGVARNSHLRSDNYFYYNCLTGRFARDNCPSYLEPRHTAALKAGGLDRLLIVTSTFMEQLTARKYTKVILMDHVDWLDAPAARKVARALGEQVLQGGLVIWRSAATCPPYVRFIRDAGFEVRCLAGANQGYMDRVNMYASFWIARRL